MGGAAGRSIGHFHPAQDEHFEVLAGTMRVKVDGAERDLAAGEEIDIRRGQVHQMWNPGDVRARVAWRTSPGLRTEQWFRAIDALHREGKVGRKGMPRPRLLGRRLSRGGYFAIGSGAPSSETSGAS